MTWLEILQSLALVSLAVALWTLDRRFRWWRSILHNDIKGLDQRVQANLAYLNLLESRTPEIEPDLREEVSRDREDSTGGP